MQLTGIGGAVEYSAYCLKKFEERLKYSGLSSYKRKRAFYDKSKDVANPK